MGHRQEDFDDIGDHPRTMGRLNGRPPLPLNAMMTGSSTGLSLQHNRVTSNLQHQQPQYQHPHPHHQPNAATLVAKSQDNDNVEDHVPTTLLKRTPSGSLFIPSGNHIRLPLFIRTFSSSGRPQWPRLLQFPALFTSRHHCN